jgi:hypothetical protein
MIRPTRGCTERLISLLRSKSQVMLLERISQLSIQSYNSNTPIQTWTIFVQEGGLFLPQDFYVAAWELLQLSYFAVLHGNEALESRISRDEIIQLVNELRRFDEERTLPELEGLSSEDQTLKIIFGLSQQQMGYQHTCTDIVEYFNRMYEILNVISRSTCDYKTFNEACLQETGLSIAAYINCFFFLFSQVVKGVDPNKIYVPHNAEGLLEGLSEANFKLLLQHMVIDQSSVRTTKLETNAFIPSPIASINNRLYVVDAFLLANKFFEGPYWAIRAHFQKNNNQYFVNKFGELAELYIEQMLGAMLPKHSFCRIERQASGKSADWKIETQRLLVLIEQKSCISPISIRRNFPNVSEVKKYFARVNEALEQLQDSTNSISTNKRKIHIVLLFDRLFLVDPTIKFHVNAGLENLQYFTISEFEEVVGMFSLAEDQFENLLIEKCDADNTIAQKDISVMLIPLCFQDGINPRPIG